MTAKHRLSWHRFSGSQSRASVGIIALMASLLVAILLPLIAVTTEPVLASPDSDWLSGWDYRIKMTIDHTDVDTDLDNFPVLVYLSASSGRTPSDVSCVFDELTSDANRKKIAVTENDGTTQCYVEIEDWDDANEKAWLWVKVPFIDNDTDTDLYLYYDSSQDNNTTYVGDPSDAVVHNVWDSNFKLVTHMRDDPDTSHIRDSTVNANDGTKTGANEPIVTTAGKIDDAQSFDGGDDRIVPPNPLNNFNPQLGLTMETWVKTDVINPAEISFIFYNGNLGEFGLWLVPGTDDFYAHVKDTIGEKGAIWSGVVTDTWYHIAITWPDGGPVKLWVDGDEKASTATAANLHNPGAVYAPRIGGFKAGSVPYERWFWDGIIDEPRVSNTARSAAWIRASYESGRDDLITFGSEETAAVEYERPIEQGFSLAGISPSGSEFGRAIEQGFSIGAVITILMEICKLLSQTFGLTGTVGITSGLSRGLTQEFSIDGELEANREYGKGVSQDFSLTGEISANMERLGSISQGFSLDGIVSANMERWGAISQGFSFTGEVSANMERLGTIDQSFSVDGTVSRGLEAGRIITQSFTFTDVVGVDREVSREIAQDFSLAESVTTKKGIAIDLSETFSLSATVAGPASFTRKLGGELSFTATVGAQYGYTHGIAQEYSLTGVVGVSSDLTRGISQDFSFAGAVGIDVERVVREHSYDLLGEFSFTDMVATIAEYCLTLPQGFSFADGVEIQVIHVKPEPISPIENQPRFMWTDTGADNYRLLVDNDIDFSSPCENRILFVTYYQIPPENSLDNGIYYWKVIAYFDGEVVESDVWSFTVGGTGAGPIDLLSIAMFIFPIILMGIALAFDNPVFASFAGVVFIFSGLYFLDTLWLALIFIGVGVYLLITAFMSEED